VSGGPPEKYLLCTRGVDPAGGPHHPLPTIHTAPWLILAAIGLTGPRALTILGIAQVARPVRPAPSSPGEHWTTRAPARRYANQTARYARERLLNHGAAGFAGPCLATLDEGHETECASIARNGRRLMLSYLIGAGRFSADRESH
jgi:hypothetical protein